MHVADHSSSYRLIGVRPRHPPRRSVALCPASTLSIGVLHHPTHHSREDEAIFSSTDHDHALDVRVRPSICRSAFAIALCVYVHLVVVVGEAIPTRPASAASSERSWRRNRSWRTRTRESTGAWPPSSKRLLTRVLIHRLPYPISPATISSALLASLTLTNRHRQSTTTSFGRCPTPNHARRLYSKVRVRG